MMGWADDIARVIAKRNFEKRLTAKSCGLWPECSCYSTIEHWAKQLSDEEKIWDMEVLEWAETSVFITLACCAHYCPDPVVKGWAKSQLKDKFWRRQKSLGIHVEQ